MREILFRGKRCDNGEGVQGYYIRAEHHWHNHGIHKDWITLGASANGGWFALHNKYAVKSETVGQFTGLTDKNGKKVFENDIIVICYETDGEEFTETKRVHYNEKKCCWYPMRWEEDEAEADPSKTFQCWSNMDMGMVLRCFDDAVKDWRKTFCDVENCSRK